MSITFFRWYGRKKFISHIRHVCFIFALDELQKLPYHWKYEHAALVTTSRASGDKTREVGQMQFGYGLSDAGINVLVYHHLLVENRAGQVLVAYAVSEAPVDLWAELARLHDQHG